MKEVIVAVLAAAWLTGASSCVSRALITVLNGLAVVDTVSR